jgi:phospholipid transport system transporter-binding protein
MTQDGDRIALDGPLNLQTVPAVLRFGLEHFAEGVRIVDFSGVTEVDSSAVGMALEWVRAVPGADGRKLQFLNLPQGFVSLARLYGVADLLPAA